ncbi:MAG: hypothetical protein LUC45_07850 [Paraprevotella sp.]|nr:hypothetical protein [Paraprevotella sp.]
MEVLELGPMKSVKTADESAVKEDENYGQIQKRRSSPIKKSRKWSLSEPFA